MCSSHRPIIAMPTARVNGIDNRYTVSDQGPWVTLSHSLALRKDRAMRIVADLPDDARHPQGARCLADAGVAR